MAYNRNANVSNPRRLAGEYSGVTRFLAQFISFVFHPLFICTYVMAFLVFVHPAAFTGFEPRVKLFRFLSVFLFTLAFPLLAIFLCWRLRLIRSMYLETTKDRIIPYVIVMFFYWWTWNVFKNLPDSPYMTVHFFKGVFFAICVAWMCNIFFKISMHAVAVGGLVMFFLMFAFNDSYASGLYISVAVLIAGAVCTARFIISDHSSREIYTGLLAGAVTQFIAWLI